MTIPPYTLDRHERAELAHLPALIAMLHLNEPQRINIDTLGAEEAAKAQTLMLEVIRTAYILERHGDEDQRRRGQEMLELTHSASDHRHCFRRLLEWVQDRGEMGWEALEMAATFVPDVVLLCILIELGAIPPESIHTFEVTWTELRARHGTTLKNALRTARTTDIEHLSIFDIPPSARGQRKRARRRRKRQKQAALTNKYMPGAHGEDN